MKHAKPMFIYVAGLDEFQMWGDSRYLLNRAHVGAYYKLAAVNEPIEEQEDRQILYTM